MLKGLRREGLSELSVEQPTSEGFTVGKEFDERARYVADIVIVALGKALERQG